MRMFKANIMFLLLFISVNANALPLSIPIYWGGGDGHYYDVVQYRADYATAERLVASMGDPTVHLAKIDSAEENNFIIQNHPMLWFCNNDADCRATFTHGVWLGGKQANVDNEPAGAWGWSDGTSFTYSLWKAGEPNDTDNNENCLAMTLSGEWNDQNCNAILEGFVIEYETPPDKSGYIVTVPLQWRKAEGGNDHWYQRIIINSIDWNSARIAAEAATWEGMRGHLVTITSAEENAFLVTAFLGERSNSLCIVPSLICSRVWYSYWLGGQWDNTLKVAWITGEENTFSLPPFPAYYSEEPTFQGFIPLMTASTYELAWYNPVTQPLFANGYLIEYEELMTENPLSKNECTATYSPATGKLVIPCLAVKINENNTPYYQLQMQQGQNFTFGVEWDTFNAR
ncbi:hypothetical protein AL038_07585 [Beggiatoa leptomitoformis]|uniref:C-type lectin domain-containing protein n=2 Tax=Beggiatoa leptomitoformis TaxID=288004 RepID=A0A2N9YI27_9GAMM|nr:C-type lectin domain-containing protein [Beggiatoa leptomitoformis]ALG67585.1 hypothetical protein AL038_07585 [Beggiatoa leptomitoformis]AUI70182.1 hypothetical protein BLE401_16730 [Beggiatoa leptomitoformis]